MNFMNVAEIFSNALSNATKENPVLITVIILLITANMFTKRKSH